MNFIKCITENNLIEAEKLFKEQMFVTVKKKLLEYKKMLSAQMTESDIEVVPKRKRTPEEMAAGMSDYKLSGRGQKEQIGKKAPTSLKVVK